MPQLYCYIRALSHKIRTPLSVIQNELTYIKTKMPEDECQRAIDACGRIKDILSKASKKITYKANFKELSVSDFSQLLTVRPEVKLEVATLNPNASLILDVNLFECAWECLLEFLQSRQKDNSYAVKIEPIGQGLEFNLRSSFKAYVSEKPQPADGYTSLCEFSYLCLDNDSVLLPIADTIISEHGWKTSVRLTGSNLEIKFSIAAKHG